MDGKKKPKKRGRKPKNLLTESKPKAEDKTDKNALEFHLKGILHMLLGHLVQDAPDH